MCTCTRYSSVKKDSSYFENDFKLKNLYVQVLVATVKYRMHGTFLSSKNRRPGCEKFRTYAYGAFCKSRQF